MSGGVPTTSSDGLRSKNPNGLSQKDTTSTGITGQSSGRVMWWIPNTYHITTSVLSMDLLASVQRTQGEAQQAGFFGDEEKEDYARRQTGWWYFLLVALLAGMAEIYIANRAYKAS